MSDTRRPVNTPHIESYSWKLQSTSAHSWRVVVQFPGVECSEVRGSHLSCTLGRRVGFEGGEGIDVATTDDVEVILTLVDKVHWQNLIEWRDHTEGEFFQDLSALSMISLWMLPCDRGTQKKEGTDLLKRSRFTNKNRSTKNLQRRRDFRMCHSLSLLRSFGTWSCKLEQNQSCVQALSIRQESAWCALES